MFYVSRFNRSQHKIPSQLNLNVSRILKNLLYTYVNNRPCELQSLFERSQTLKVDWTGSVAVSVANICRNNLLCSNLPDPHSTRKTIITFMMVIANIWSEFINLMSTLTPCTTLSIESQIFFYTILAIETLINSWFQRPADHWLFLIA